MAQTLAILVPGWLEQGQGHVIEHFNIKIHIPYEGIRASHKTQYLLETPKNVNPKR